MAVPPLSAREVAPGGVGAVNKRWRAGYLQGYVSERLLGWATRRRAGLDGLRKDARVTVRRDGAAGCCGQVRGVLDAEGAAWGG